MFSSGDDIPNDLLIAIMAALEAGASVEENFDNMLLKNDTKINNENESSSSSLFFKEGTQIFAHTDLDSNDRIKKFLDKNLKDYCVISKEGERIYVKGKSSSAWVIDPLDGLTNFTSGIEYFVISIAKVSLVTWQPELAVVYHPLSKALYTAKQGEGCFFHSLKKLLKNIEVNNLKRGELVSFLADSAYYKRLEISKKYMPNKSIIEIGSSMPHEEYIIRLTETMSCFLDGVPRDLCASTYSATKIAHSFITFFSAANLHLWNIVPIVLLVEEAGGIVANEYGLNQGLREYIKAQTECYLKTYCPDNENESKKEYKEAVGGDQAKIIVCASKEILERYLPAVRLNHKEAKLTYKLPSSPASTS